MTALKSVPAEAVHEGDGDDGHGDHGGPDADRGVGGLVLRDPGVLQVTGRVVEDAHDAGELGGNSKEKKLALVLDSDSLHQEKAQKWVD